MSRNLVHVSLKLSFEISSALNRPRQEENASKRPAQRPTAPSGGRCLKEDSGVIRRADVWMRRSYVIGQDTRCERRNH